MYSRYKKKTQPKAWFSNQPQCNLASRKSPVRIRLFFYFTELLRLAFEESQRTNWLESHITNPVPVLARRGLWDT
jgi:hypothetical protein